MDNWGYLLSDCSRRLRRLFDERMRSLGMTGPQARLLVILETREGASQSYYANELDVEPITLCRMVDRMEEADLIERRPDPADRRARLVFRTRRAKQIETQIKAEIETLLDEVAQDLDSAERRTLGGLLSRISDGVARLDQRQPADG